MPGTKSNGVAVTGINTITKIVNFIDVNRLTAKIPNGSLDIIASAQENKYIYDNQIGKNREGVSNQQAKAILNWFDYYQDQGNIKPFRDLMAQIGGHKRCTLSISPYDRHNTVRFN